MLESLDRREKVVRLIGTFALLLVALTTVSACSAPPPSLTQAKQPAQREAASPQRVIPRSEIISADATPEDVVRTYLDASNRGEGAVLNALLGRNGSELNRDMPSTTASIANVRIRPAAGTDPDAVAKVSAEVQVLDTDNYFGLDPGQAVIRFVVRRDDDGLWYVSTISSTQE